MAASLRRQESEVEQELKLALEEACVEVGVTLSLATSPLAWWAFDENHVDPGVGDLAGWLALTRRRSYKPSPLNKYRKYALPLDASETLGEQPEEEGAEENREAEDDETAVTPPQMSLKERLGNAAEADVLGKDFNWNNLLSVHRTEHALAGKEEADNRDSFGSTEVTVNSGGVVYFALFQNSPAESGDVDGGNGHVREAAAVFKFGSSRLATQSERLGIEVARHLGVATPQARVVHSNTQEWKEIREATERVRDTAEVEDKEVGVQTCEELLEALHLSRCMLIMGFIHGKPLAESPQAFTPQEVALKTASALGRTLVLDLVLRNEDRLVCHELGWRGNPGNLLVTDRAPHGLHEVGPRIVETKSEILKHKRSQSLTRASTLSATDLGSQLVKMNRCPSPEPSMLEATKSLSLRSYLVPDGAEGPKNYTKVVIAANKISALTQNSESKCLLVAIDSGVPRRPPAMKAEHDRRSYPKMVELLLNDEDFAANLLREISSGNLGPQFEWTTMSTVTGTPNLSDENMITEGTDHGKDAKAFQRGVVGGLHDMQILRIFLLKLYRTLDHLLHEFMVYMSKQGLTQDNEPQKLDSKPNSPQMYTKGTSARGSPRPPSSGGRPSSSPKGVIPHLEKLNTNLQEDNLVDSDGGYSAGSETVVGSQNSLSSSASSRAISTSCSMDSAVEAPSPNVSKSPSTGKSVPNSPSTPSTAKSPKGSPRLSALRVSTPPSGGSPRTSPRVSSPNKISPSRENWHGKGSPGRLTLKLKDVSKTAKIDDGVSKKLEWWDEKLRVEGQKLCHEQGFTTGFLEGGGTHSLVDSYELKVRLEHVLERMTMISNGSDTERPSCVLPHLYIGGALSARSVNTLQHLGITYILCLCPSDLADMNTGDFPDLFKYQHYPVHDIEDEQIADYFERACTFVDNVEGEGGKILIHCFEGKSRSATVVLAYLMLRKGHTLAQAWTLLKAVHRRTQPNDGFMKGLVELDKQLHGNASMSFLQRRPIAQTCPVCNKFGGFSTASFQQHFQRAHPGTVLPPSINTIV